MKSKNKPEVILVQPSGMYWQPGVSRGHSTSDAYELALLNHYLKKEGIESDYLVQRPLGTNKDFYQGTKRITPAAPDIDKLAEEISQGNPRVVGIEAMSCYSDNAIKLASQIKARNKDIVIVTGGYHPSGYPEMLQDAKGNIDYAVLGAGEKTLTNLVKSILSGVKPSKGRQVRALPQIGENSRRTAINQSAYALINNGEVQLVGRLESDLIESFDKIGIPERKMEYQDGSVSGVLSIIPPNKQVMATTQTRRGCDGGCTYCASSNVYGKKGNKLFSGSNVRSASNVVSELEYLSRLGINFIFFTDPTFNEDGKYMKELARGIIEAKKQGTISSEMALYAMLRPFSQKQMEQRGLSLEQYKLLRQAGFTRIAFGVESPDNETLKTFGRSNTLSDLERHLEEIHNCGMFTRGFMMYGHEKETPESLSRYVDVMKSLHVDEWRLSPMAPFVGTISGDAFLARQEKRDFTKHDALYPVVVPGAIKQKFSSAGFSAEDEARAFMINWQKATIKSVYESEEWKARMKEKYQRFPELREGIDFYLNYLKNNLGDSFNNNSNTGEGKNGI